MDKALQTVRAWLDYHSDRSHSGPGPSFSTDWFTQHEDAWRQHVVPRLRTVSGARWLEVGSFEGRSALWTLDNVLAPTATLTCVDIWWFPYETTFDSNLAMHAGRITKLRGTSRQILPTLPTASFHGIYIDGSHEEGDVAQDAANAWRLARQGAVIVFDDYGSTEYTGVRTALDRFMGMAGSTVLHKDWQLILLKP